MLRLSRFSSSVFPIRIINRRCISTKRENIVYAESVRHALENNQPVVALESTIITHGMPFPQNIECALECERQVAKSGAVPATIAILKGRLTIGLSANDIEHIAQLNDGQVVKTSRRDFAHVIGNKLYGGTTVSGTLLAAHMAGINVLATGGIGGVHRSGETTMDISADLVEMGRTPIAVVSSGIKSILDIPRTLEYLETQGVYVATFGPDTNFPAFYTRTSGCKSPYSVETANEAAHIIKAADDLGLRSGMLFAVPVPEEYALDSAEMEAVIEQALKLARHDGVEGKDITPFLLSHVSRATKGKSLETNMCLVQNNARVGGEIASELCKLQQSARPVTSEGKPAEHNSTSNPTVLIGGSVLDRCVTVLDDDIKLDGRIHGGEIRESAGGVARNICEALGKLQPPSQERAVFVTAVGDDEGGKAISASLSGQCPLVVPAARTAQCMVVFDAGGECRFLVGDMDVHELLTPDVIRRHEKQIADAPLLIVDGNLSLEAMEEALRIAHKHHVPVFFEPTDHHCSKKPFETDMWKAVQFISPNYHELKVIAEHLSLSISEASSQDKLLSAASLAKQVAQRVPNVLVTIGDQGLIIARRNNAGAPLLTNFNSDRNAIQVRRYPALKCNNLVNVSGAGDCLAAGIISSMIDGRTEENCVNVGLHAALYSLNSCSAIPKSFFSHKHSCWRENAEYVTLEV